MPTILIGGYYGAGNIGDEAILIAIVDELRAQKPKEMDLSFIVLSWDPEKTSRELEVGAIHWKDIKGLVDAIQKTDLIIVGGGGIFQDYWGFDPETYLRKASRDISAFGSLPLLAKLLEIPCMIYAVGVGPFRSDTARDHTRLAFERCQVATVRDEESLTYLKETGFNINDPAGPMVKVLPDPVFSLTTSNEDVELVERFLEQRKIDFGVPLLGISLRHWDINNSPEEWLSALALGLRAFLEANSEVHCLLIPFQVLPATAFTDDVPSLKSLAEKLDYPGRIHLIDEPLTPQFAQALIAHCEVIIGMRLHSVISAINVGTPVVALSYAPKVESVMKFSGLEEFCNSALSLQPEAFAQQLQKAWDQRSDISIKMKAIGHVLSNKTKEHAQFALGLLTMTHRQDEFNFTQQFVLSQIRQLYKADQAYEQMRETLQEQIRELQEQVWDLQAIESELIFQNADLQTKNAELRDTLHAIRSTRVWKLGQQYYRLRDNSLLRFPYAFAVTTKREGLSTAIRRAKSGQLTLLHTEPVKTMAAAETVRSVVTAINARPYKGVVVLTSTFAFDELYNQRVINLSKYLAREGWGVVFVAWVWHDASEAPVKEVKENIFQIPSNIFLEGYDALQHLSAQEKIFIVEFPYPEFLDAAIKLKSFDFIAIYDIIDEWEEFHQVGQAEWFDRDVEQGLVVNANIITAVTDPLVEKFSNLRNDIHLIPNGFDPAFLGNYQNIAQRHFKHDKINLGYFGHLTPSWFDWSFIKEILELAKHQNLDLDIHLIGYGEPNLHKTLGHYQENIVFHGKVHPENLHDYVKDWDLAILPFKSSPLSRAVDPIKIYEYIYFGLPVIVKGIPHLINLSNVHVVSDAVEFMDTLIGLRDQKIVRETSHDIFNYTWEQRFNQLIQILTGGSWMSL